MGSEFASMSKQPAEQLSSSPSEKTVEPLSSTHLVLQLQRTLGNQGVLRFIQSGQLGVSQPGDNEREVDRVADQVMRMPDSQAQLPNEGEGSGSADPSTPGEAGTNSSGEGGQPLPDAVRFHFEPRFGYDFGRVRIHKDTHSAQSARELGARAYTIGRSIVFGKGEFAPATSEGRRLLAHELTHVIQQDQVADSSRPALQMQRAQPGQQATTQAGQPTQRQADYIQLACSVIQDILSGLETGQTWEFEDDLALQGDEELGPRDEEPSPRDEEPGPRRPESITVQRHDVLAQVVEDLEVLVQELRAGTLNPEHDVTRRRLAILRDDRFGPGELLPWTPRLATGENTAFGYGLRTRRNRQGRIIHLRPSRSWYIWHPPSSPPGILRPAWWARTLEVPACRPPGTPDDDRLDQPPLPSVWTPGATPAQVVWVTSFAGQLNWSEAASPGSVEHQTYRDPVEQRRYIIYRGTEYDLLPDGRLGPAVRRRQ